MTKVRKAHSMRVVMCDAGHCHIEFLDRNRNVFADFGMDPDQAIDVGVGILDMVNPDEDETVPDGATIQ